MPGRRRSGRWATTLVPLLLLAVVGAVGYGLARYSFVYDHNRFNPASLESASPTYFYLDWTRDLPDLPAVRARLGPDGIFVLPPLEVVRSSSSRARSASTTGCCAGASPNWMRSSAGSSTGW